MEAVDGSDCETIQQDTQLPTMKNSEQAIIGKLIKLKHYHRLSNAAVDDIIELVESVCSELSTRVITAINMSEQSFSIELSSQLLEAVSESMTSPLVSIKTTYKQQQFIANNLSYYVVCVTYILV